MTREREVLDRGTEAFNNHDIAAFSQAYAQSAELRAPGGMVVKGRDAIMEFTRTWFDAFPDCRLRAENIIEAGTTLVEEGIFTGTHTGVFRTPMGDIPPTGRRVEGRYVDVFDFENGLIVSDRLSFDRMELMEQLGLVPTPAGASS